MYICHFAILSYKIVGYLERKTILRSDKMSKMREKDKKNEIIQSFLSLPLKHRKA